MRSQILETPGTTPVRKLESGFQIHV